MIGESDRSQSALSGRVRFDQLPGVVLDPEVLAANHIVGFNSRDVRSRPFNLLRTSVAKKLKEGGHRLVGITSATPDAGKSFLTLNLGSSLAKVSEGPVYLIDLDLRRASIASAAGLEPEKSVTDFLMGEVDELSEAGLRVEQSNLALFPATKCTQPTVELLATERFVGMLATLRDRSDAATILFDLPPAFADDDAMIAMQELDAYLLVVDTGKTTKKQVQDVIKMLTPSPCVGTVLNRYEGGVADPYGYGYGYSSYESYYDRTK